MKKVYLDNAATTPMYPEVISVMLESMTQSFGNPSSTHSFGRNAKAAVENSRKNIAKYLNASTNEIVFTSGGTEADNLILKNAISHLNIQHIVTSKIEHHAVLNTVEFLASKNTLIHYVNITPSGEIDYCHLKKILSEINQPTLVSLMYVNNEIGTILDFTTIQKLKNEFHFLFHTDAVQAVGHFHIDLQNSPIDFLAASAHKFHGPKGIGFAYFKKGTAIQPEILGGEQERGTRAGTENIAAIVGMEKALSICLSNLNDDLYHLKNIKLYCIQKLKNIPNIRFNGISNNLYKSTHTLINIQFNKEIPMLLFQLDLKGIAVSGGSACQSGAHKGSHVLQNILNEKEQQHTSIRVSFSKFTTYDDIDDFINALS